MKFLDSILKSALLLIPFSCGCTGGAIQLPSLPGAGLSGLYAGQIGGRLYVAGGCNFPDKPLAEGGKKKFYDEILTLTDNGWEIVGRLPEESAYGAYIQTDAGILILGGANMDGSLDKVCLLTLEGVEELPSLPKPLEQAAWYNTGEVLYLAGGLSNGEPSLEVFSFDGKEWSVAGTLPRPIVQGVAVMSGEGLCIWGGFDPLAKKTVTGGFRLNTVTGEWSNFSAAITFVGSAPLGDFAAGGCDAGIFNHALGLSGEELQQYRIQPPEYYRFRGELLRFDPGSCRWDRIVSSPHLARAGAALAIFEGDIVSIGGELKPGVRSPEVWMFKTDSEK